MARDYCAEMFWFDGRTPETIEATYDVIDVFNADALGGNASAISEWRNYLAQPSSHSCCFGSYMRACRQPPLAATTASMRLAALLGKLT